LSHSPGIPAAGAPIPDDLPLFRLVKTTQCKPVDGQWQLTGSGFDNASGTTDMSVFLSDTLAGLQRTTDDLPERTFPDPELWGVAVIGETKFLRDDESQDVRRTPQPGEPAHGDVTGPKNSNRRSRIRKKADWVFPPPAPPS
jgi:hypothetical protein